nr:kyphoscoliosis peptidase-like isoform X2 [Zootoca vivipara]
MGGVQASMPPPEEDLYEQLLQLKRLHLSCLMLQIELAKLKLDAYEQKDFKMKEEQGSTLSQKQSDGKSVLMDLMQFKELDAHALKVNVKDSVENLVSALLQKAHSDLEKVRAIWMWICHHIEYDVEGYRNRDKAFYKPADVLRSGKAICSGYARLFEEMCRVAGIQCKYLAGGCKSDDFKGKSRHAWNAVYLDGKWHIFWTDTWQAAMWMTLVQVHFQI